MLQVKVFDALEAQVQTMQFVNVEFFIALIVGALAALCFWTMFKGAV